MAEVLRMPRMSDTMTEGVIVQWLKKEGDKVKSGEVLAEVETDKATMELESYTDGVLLHVGVGPGASVAVDGVIAVIGKEGEDWQAALGESGSPATAPAGGDKSTETPEATTKKVAPTPQAPVAEKATPEAPVAEKASSEAPVAGKASPEVSTSPTKDQAQEAPTPTVKAEGNSVEVSNQPQVAQPNEATNGNNIPTDDRLKISPLARKIAGEAGIDLGGLAGHGTGDGGRIVRRDVEEFKEHGPTQTPEAQQEGVAPKEEAIQQAQPQVPINAPAGAQFEEVKVSQMRKTIARRLVESKSTAPHFYLTMEVRMDKATTFRKELNEYLGSKTSFNDLIIKACAVALNKHPNVNASWMGDSIRLHKVVNIGVAVAVEDGLVVPVIRDADRKGVAQIGTEVKDMAERARSKKLNLNEMEGNTFTISNLGMFGIEQFTAIINPPDACILAVGAITAQPVVEGNEIKVGQVMKMTLSCDHRVVDGATGAAFLQTLKSLLEDPMRMLA